jgi:hypothetical protein
MQVLGCEGDNELPLDFHGHLGASLREYESVVLICRCQRRIVSHGAPSSAATSASASVNQYPHGPFFT